MIFPIEHICDRQHYYAFWQGVCDQQQGRECRFSLPTTAEQEAYLCGFKEGERLAIR